MSSAPLVMSVKKSAPKAMIIRRSNRDCASSCSMTPSERSHQDVENDKDASDSDYESDHGEDRFDHLGKLMNIRWIGPGRSIPILSFDTHGFFHEDPCLKNVGVQNNLACKVTGDSQILREILTAHGFREVGMLQRRYNLAWTGRHTKPSYVKRMSNCHVINHFPKTEELTRKDKLYKNIRKMQETKGKEPFDFVPLSFKMPSEYRSLRTHYKKERGLYIVKPVSLSRGRGVYVIDNPKKINSVHVEGPGETRHETRHKNIVSKYIPNPLVINGYKCDLRIYVTVTSFDPVVIYMYSEGLTRFATVKYDLASQDLTERCMHLTNYSINMENEQYIKNNNSMVENEGSKWSLGALLRYFKSQGKDSAAIMFSIEDIVIKTILSVEWKVGAACKRYVRNRHNCFELFGFDILLDDKYKPWLIEVNLSPSLGCDTPLDVKVKGNMLCDLLNLVGVRCYDPHMQNLGANDHKSWLTVIRNRLKNSYGHYYYRLCRDACHRAWGLRHSRHRLRTMLDLENNWASRSPSNLVKKTKAVEMLATLTPNEVEMIQKVREEDARRFGWVRIFPTSDSWDLYHTYMDFPTTNNLVLHQRLYPERHKVMTAGRSPLAGLVTPSPSVNELLFQVTGQKKDKNEKVSKAYIEKLHRVHQYETPLSVAPPANFRQKHEMEPNRPLSVDANPSWNQILLASSQKARACSHSSDKTFGMEGLIPILQKLHDENNLPTEPKTDLAYWLLHKHSLSSRQARVTFTMYMLHICRILRVYAAHVSGPEQAQDQDLLQLMMLVVHFLKMSAKCLALPLQLDIPEDLTVVQDCIAQVARNLEEFIKLYIQKTCIVSKDPCHLVCKDVPGSQNGEITQDDSTFEQFVCRASVNELEYLLKSYWQQNDLVATLLGNMLQPVPVGS